MLVHSTFGLRGSVLWASYIMKAESGGSSGFQAQERTLGLMVGLLRWDMYRWFKAPQKRVPDDEDPQNALNLTTKTLFLYPGLVHKSESFR